jgi:hypothetical protein
MFDSTSPAMPEPYATIAAMRRNGHTEREIAAHLGWPYDAVRRRSRRWAAKHPEFEMPEPPLRPATPKIIIVVDAVQRGLTPAQIEAEHGFSRTAISNAVARARATGLLPAITRKPRTNAARHEAIVKVGGAPGMGFVRDILNAMPRSAYNALLNQTRPTDAHLATTIARLLTEHLHGKK